MTNRISGPAVGKNPFGPQWPNASSSSSEFVGGQVEERLFGRGRPELAEPDETTAALLARLDGYRKKLARLAGDAETDYWLQLAAGLIAAIDIAGCIYVGRTFLLRTADRLALQVGVLAHEIGHRPRRWLEYRSAAPLSARELEDLCRLEETRADYFAGFALAQLEMPAEPLCDYLSEIQAHPHPEYFSAPLRAVTIREGHEAGRRRQSNLQKFFPELHRATSANGDLGHG